MSLRLWLRSSLQQYGVGLTLRIPSPHPSSRFARLGNGLASLLPRLVALHPSKPTPGLPGPRRCTLAGIALRGSRLHFPERARRNEGIYRKRREGRKGRYPALSTTEDTEEHEGKGFTADLANEIFFAAGG